MKKHYQKETCGCENKASLPLWQKWIIFIYVVVIMFIVGRPLVVLQLVSRASSYADMGLYPDAIRVYQKAIFIDPKNSDLWNDLGYVFQRLQNQENAMMSYRKAIEVDPANRDAFLNLGVILMIREDYKQAVELLEHIRFLGPEKHEGSSLGQLDHYYLALRLLTTCYEALGDFQAKELILSDLNQHSSHIDPEERN